MVYLSNYCPAKKGYRFVLLIFSFSVSSLKVLISEMSEDSSKPCCNKDVEEMDVPEQQQDDNKENVPDAVPQQEAKVTEYLKSDQQVSNLVSTKNIKSRCPELLISDVLAAEFSEDKDLFYLKRYQFRQVAITGRLVRMGNYKNTMQFVLDDGTGRISVMGIVRNKYNQYYGDLRDEIKAKEEINLYKCYTFDDKVQRWFENQAKKNIRKGDEEELEYDSVVLVIGRLKQFEDRVVFANSMNIVFENPERYVEKWRKDRERDKSDPMSFYHYGERCEDEDTVAWYSSKIVIQQ